MMPPPGRVRRRTDRRIGRWVITFVCCGARQRMRWQLHWVESELGSLEDSQTTDRELQDAYESTVHRYRQSAEALSERMALLNLTIPLVNLLR